VILFFDEITEYADFKQKYHEERPVSCLIFVDNYEELLESTANAFRPHLEAQIYKRINDWTNEHGGVLVKYEKDKYSVLFQYRYLEKFVANKFEILSQIRNISEGNTIPASISIGVGTCGRDIIENNEFAKTAINMALGRGGDQAVIKDNEQLSFYGGNSKEYEKSTRVKARVVSVALSGLIENANNVIVMSKGRLAMQGSVAEVFERSEELRSMGLDVPQITELTHGLIKDGVDLRPDIYTVKFAAEEYARLLKEAENV